MSTQQDISEAIAKLIDANWSDIVTEIEASPIKSNQLNIQTIIKKDDNSNISFSLKFSFRKQTVVSQPTVVSVNSNKN